MGPVVEPPRRLMPQIIATPVGWVDDRLGAVMQPYEPESPDRRGSMRQTPHARRQAIVHPTTNPTPVLTAMHAAAVTSMTKNSARVF